MHYWLKTAHFLRIFVSLTACWVAHLLPALAQTPSSEVLAVGRLVLCESEDNKRQTCPTYSHAVVTLENQKSQVKCILGKNWGFEEQTSQIWVDQGCRAEFRVRSLSFSRTIDLRKIVETDWGYPLTPCGPLAALAIAENKVVCVKAGSQFRAGIIYQYKAKGNLATFTPLYRTTNPSTQDRLSHSFSALNLTKRNSAETFFDYLDLLVRTQGANLKSCTSEGVSLVLQDKEGVCTNPFLDLKSQVGYGYGETDDQVGFSSTLAIAPLEPTQDPPPTIEPLFRTLRFQTLGEYQDCVSDIFNLYKDRAKFEASQQQRQSTGERASCVAINPSLLSNAVQEGLSASEAYQLLEDIAVKSTFFPPNVVRQRIALELCFSYSVDEKNEEVQQLLQGCALR